MFRGLAHGGWTDIWSVAVDGSDLRELTHDPNYDEVPRVSPSGATIAWTHWLERDPATLPPGARNDTYNVYLMGPSGEDKRPFLPSFHWSDSFAFRQPSTSIGRHDFLAHEFRPSLRFDGKGDLRLGSGEDWRPLEFHSFLSEVHDGEGDAPAEDGGPTTHEVCDENQRCISAKEPAPLSAMVGTGRSTIDIVGDGAEENYRAPSAELAKPTCGGHTDDLRDCDTGPRSKIYYNLIQRAEPGYHYIQYWFFYRFSHALDNPLGDIFRGRHEGDWELVTVAPSVTDPGTFDFVAFSQHTRQVAYLREQLACDGGKKGSCGSDAEKTGRRVSSFVAAGTHANYPGSCSLDVPLVGGLGPSPCFQSVPLVGSPGPLPDPVLPEREHDGDARWGRDDDSDALERFPATGPAPAPEDSPERRVELWRQGPQNWTDWPGHWGRGAGRSPGQRDVFWRPADSNCADFEGCQLPSSASASAQTNARTAALAEPEPSPSSSEDLSLKACPAWFGAGLSATACSPSRLAAAYDAQALGKPGAFGLRSSGEVTAADDAPGLAQLSSDPLVPGESTTLAGEAPQDTELWVRFIAEDKLFHAHFTNLGLEQGGEATVRLADGDLRLTRPTERRSRRSRSRRPSSLRRRPRPTRSIPHPRPTPSSRRPRSARDRVPLLRVPPSPFAPSRPGSTGAGCACAGAWRARA